MLSNSERPYLDRWPKAQRVLLIEDSIHFQKSIRIVFQEHFPKVELYIADDGISGMVMLGALVPDVLILDLMLPGVHSMDGRKLIKALCSYPIFQPMKLIVTTSMSSAELKKHHTLLRNLSVVHKKDLAFRLPEELRSKCYMSYPTET